MPGLTGRVRQIMGPIEWAMLSARSVLWGGSVFFVGVPFSLLVWRQTHIASGLASILNATTPFWTVLVAHALTKDERATPAKIVGVLVGLVGVAIMVGGAALRDFGRDVPAQLACLAATLVLRARRRLRPALPGRWGWRRWPPRPDSSRPPPSCYSPSRWRSIDPGGSRCPGPAAWGAIGGLAVLSTAAAYVLYFRILATAGATNLLLVTFLLPVTAILLGTLVLGETLAASHVTGMAFIAAGLVAIDGRLLASPRTRPRNPET